MKKFTTEHPVISFFLGTITITTLSIVIFWSITGIYTACQIGSAISGGCLIGGICVLINKAIAKGYEKKTGESLQELVDRTEKENQHARKKQKVKKRMTILMTDYRINYVYRYSFFPTDAI